MENVKSQMAKGWKMLKVTWEMDGKCKRSNGKCEFEKVKCQIANPNQTN